MRKLVLFLISTLVLLAAGLAGYEWYLSVYDPDPAVKRLRQAGQGRWKWASLVHRPAATPGLPYELSPGFEGRHLGVEVRVNSAGMRDDEVLAGDDPDRVRIVVLGDSTTFGFGVENDETYSAVLEGFLNERGRDGLAYEVLNMGVSGYSTLNEAVVLESKALDFEPDLVVVGYNLNDPDVELLQPLQRAFSDQAWWERTHVWQKLVQADFARRVRELGGGDRLKFAHAPGEANWRSVLEGFERMAAVGRRESLPILVVIWPSGIASESWESYRYAPLHEQVSAAAEDAGLEVMDLWPVFSDLDAKGLPYLLPDSHPNPKGHVMGAHAIGRHVLKEHDRYFPEHARSPRSGSR